MKKIWLLFSFTFLLITSNLYAAESNVLVTQEEAKPMSKINIVQPSENIKAVPIIGYKLVYIETEATMLDFLPKELEEVNKALAAQNIKPNNQVIIYLNYEGYAKKNDFSPVYNPNQDDNVDTTDYSNYTNQEGLTLNLSDLAKNYSFPFLTTKRRVLVGALINDSYPFNGNSTIKVVEFNQPDAKGLQYFSKKYYNDEAGNSITKNNEKDIQEQSQNASNNNVKVDFNAEASPDPNKDATKIYTREELIAQRAAMFQYMNLGIFKNTKFIGMMEMLDDRFTLYGYYTLPGNLSDFLPKSSTATTNNNQSTN
ncbi:hypothetical protein ACFX5K_03795 [Rickettsiales bacterium LUAb2]